MLKLWSKFTALVNALALPVHYTKLWCSVSYMQTYAMDVFFLLQPISVS